MTEYISMAMAERITTRVAEVVGGMIAGKGLSLDLAVAIGYQIGYTVSNEFVQPVPDKKGGPALLQDKHGTLWRECPDNKVCLAKNGAGVQENRDAIEYYLGPLRRYVP
jgi:hypothetical protein